VYAYISQLQSRNHFFLLKRQIGLRSREVSTATGLLPSCSAGRGAKRWGWETKGSRGCCLLICCSAFNCPWCSLNSAGSFSV